MWMAYSKKYYKFFIRIDMGIPHVRIIILMTVKEFIDRFNETGLEAEYTEINFEDEPFYIQKVQDFRVWAGEIIFSPYILDK